MNIGLQIVIQLILGIIGVNLIKKFPSGITKDMNNELDGYDPLRLEAKNSKMTDNNHHLDNPDVVNGTNTSIDKKNAATGRKGIFTPLKTLGQNVANSGVGKVAKVAVGAAMVAGGAGMAVAAVGAKAAATGIKAADRKLGASRAIKGFAKPLINNVRYKATKTAGIAKNKIVGQVNRVKDFAGNAISDNTKRKIKGAMNAGKFYRTLAVEKTKHYASQAKDKAETAYLYGLEAKDFIKDKAETAYLYGLEAKDIAKATMGFGVASLGVKKIADSIKGSRGNDFKITGVSTDPLINNYTGARGQIGNTQQRILNVSNTRNIRYHMDKTLNEILAEREESKKTKNHELANQISQELEENTKEINEDIYKKLEDMFINEDSKEYKKMQAQMQKVFKEIFNDSISKAIKESIQTTRHINNGKDGMDQKQQETLPKHEIRYAEPAEKINPSIIRDNNANTTSTERENLTSPIIVENPDTIRRQQVTAVRTDNHENQTRITYSSNTSSENEQVPAQVTISKQTTRRNTKVEAESKAKTIVDERSTINNIDNATVVAPDEPFKEYGRRKSTRQASNAKPREKNVEVNPFKRDNYELINNSDEGDKVIPFDNRRSSRKKKGKGKSA